MLVGIISLIIFIVLTGYTAFFSISIKRMTIYYINFFLLNLEKHKWIKI